jgi:hypothetical protein
MTAQGDNAMDLPRLDDAPPTLNRDTLDHKSKD